MLKLTYLIIIPLLLYSAHFTDAYLEKFSLSDELAAVSQFLEEEELPPEYLDIFTKALDEILENETSRTIGYHGHGQKGRIFQDIVKGVYEVVLGIEISKDFHFLRCPGHPRYSYITDNPKVDFLEKQYWPSVNLQNLILDVYFLEPLNRDCNTSYRHSDFTAEERRKILLLIPAQSEKYIRPKRAILRYDEEQIFLDIISILGHPEYIKEHFSHEGILKRFEDAHSLDDVYDFITFFLCERLGINLNLLEKVHFNTIIHALFIATEFQRFHQGNEYDCMAGTNYVLSMNPSPFAGTLGFESTLRHFILDGDGVEGGQHFQKDDYQYLFEAVGLNPNHYIFVVEAAAAVLKSEGVKGGVLLQIDDATDDRTLMNHISYISYAFGYQYDNLFSTSDLIDGNIPFSEELQVRLIFDNRHTLNPHSGLRVKRYTFGSTKNLDEKVRQAIEDVLRNLPLDTAKRDAYKRHLKEMYNY